MAKRTQEDRLADALKIAKQHDAAHTTTTLEALRARVHAGATDVRKHIIKHGFGHVLSSTGDSHA